MNKRVLSYKDIGKVKSVLLTLPVGDGQDEQGEEDMVTYEVRGLSPREGLMRDSILTSRAEPVPPTKQRAVVPAGGKLNAGEITMEEYGDESDPTYLDQKALYDAEDPLWLQRFSMYSLMTAVRGFDITDADIEKELGEKAHPKEPFDSLVQRLDQLCEIIYTEFDMRHLNRIMNKIMELTGVQSGDINFI